MNKLFRIGVLLSVLFLTYQGQAQGQSGLKNVAIFIFEGVEPLDLCGPGDVFETTRVNGSRFFNVYTVASSPEIVKGHFIQITPDYTVENCPKPDIIVTPGGNSNIALEDEKGLHWIAASADDADVVFSVCNGAFILAKAGLLEHKKATTHFYFYSSLRDFAPNTEVLEKTRFVDNGRIITAEGISAGIDGALHVVSRLLGKDVASATAKHLVYEKWQPDTGIVTRSRLLSNLKNHQAVDITPTSDQPIFVGDVRTVVQEFLTKGEISSALNVANFGVEKFPESALARQDRALIDLLQKTPDSETRKQQYGIYLAMLQSDLERIEHYGWSESLQFFRDLAEVGLLNEGSVNSLGYDLLAQGRNEEAIAVFKINVQTFPESWNVYDSLAEGYMKNGQTEDAIHFYNRSLKLNPENNNAVRMIEKLSH